VKKFKSKREEGKKRRVHHRGSRGIAEVTERLINPTNGFTTEDTESAEMRKR